MGLTPILDSFGPSPTNDSTDARAVWPCHQPPDRAQEQTCPAVTFLRTMTRYRPAWSGSCARYLPLGPVSAVDTIRQEAPEMRRWIVTYRRLLHVCVPSIARAMPEATR